MQMKGWSPRRKATHFVELLRDGCYGDGRERRLDNCFENGQGSEVVAQFVRLYDASAVVRSTCARYEAGRYIGWSDWLETAAKHGVFIGSEDLERWIECAAKYEMIVCVPVPQLETNLFSGQ